MKSMILSGIALLAVYVDADVYMHNPRGSNNRLNERSANRNNGNRMFDSQNNNRGGYNKGDVGDQAFGNNVGDFKDQYEMQYFESEEGNGGKSHLMVEWTNQHGCGGNEHADEHKLNCEIVMQYMCTPYGTHTTQAKNRYQKLDYINQEAGLTDNTNDGTGEGNHNPNIDAADHMLTKDEGAEKSCFITRDNNPTCVPVTSANMNVDACTPIDGLNEAACSTWNEANSPWANKLIWKEDPYKKNAAPAYNNNNVPGNRNQNQRRRLRDGQNTNRQDFNRGGQDDTQAARMQQKQADVDDTEGLHESWEYYDECYRRERNRGLFTADQNLRNNAFGYSSAIYTRQNPNNNRRGYECPEERDYWPYWHPSPWVDVAVLTDRLDRCEFYKSESQNVKPKHACRPGSAAGTSQRCKRFNNENQCTTSNLGCNWVEVGSHDKPAPDCIQGPWSRVNHLGNGRYGQANSYNWTIPHFGMDMKCVFRLRYNISTDDYNGALVNNSFNQNNGQGVQSPVRQNPAVDIGVGSTALRLAINTAQFGRTFQDRSHVFHIRARPNTVTNGRPLQSPTNPLSQNFFGGRDIYNLNVRGKRCNIVQCFPSVEYDFIPNKLVAKQDDIIHMQWTGSNTHNNGNPAGDGQAGDAGEGTRGTDRHNFVEATENYGSYFPKPVSKSTLFRNMRDAYPAERIYHDEDAGKSWEDYKTNLQIRAATAGYLKGYNKVTRVYEASKASENNNNQGQGNLNSDVDDFNVLLNNAPASFPGFLAKFSPGSYNYICTRNNNFSNRDQKGHLHITV